MSISGNGTEALARRSSGMRVVRVRGNAHDVVMSPRARFWWLIGSGLVVLGLGWAAVIVHDLAPTRWPKLAIRWSPSVDHVLRARIGPYPIGANPAQLRIDTARFSVATVETSARRGGGFADRAVQCLAARAFGCDSLSGLEWLPGDPAALAALARLSRSPDVIVRRAVYWYLHAQPETVGLVEQGLADADPEVQARAVRVVIAGRPVLKLSPSAADRLVSLLDALPRPCLVEDWAKLSAGSGHGEGHPDRREEPREIPMRVSTPSEAVAAAARLHEQALLALAIVEPVRARALVDVRDLPQSLRLEFADALPLSTDHLPWLRVLATDGDTAVAKAARRRLVYMARDTIEAYVALAAICGPDDPCWSSLVQPFAVYLWRQATPEQRTRLEQALPDRERAQLLVKIHEDQSAASAPTRP